MKKIFIIANWKSNKTTQEAEEWLDSIANRHLPDANEKEIIVCPPFTLLPLFKDVVDEKKLPIKISAQDISPFEKGAYTGEVNASQIKEFAEYTLIGHSERRNNFSETDEMLAKKVTQALTNELQPIFCIQSKDTPIPEDVKLVAFEPISAIGTGHPDTPEDAEAVAKIVKEKYPGIAVLYGGSVTAEQVQMFTQLPSIDGVLVGGASLDPEKFVQIIEKA